MRKVRKKKSVLGNRVEAGKGTRGRRRLRRSKLWSERIGEALLHMPAMHTRRATARYLQRSVRKGDSAKGFGSSLFFPFLPPRCNYWGWHQHLELALGCTKLHNKAYRWGIALLIHESAFGRMIYGWRNPTRCTSVVHRTLVRHALLYLQLCPNYSSARPLLVLGPLQESARARRPRPGISTSAATRCKRMSPTSPSPICITALSTGTGVLTDDSTSENIVHFYICNEAKLLYFTNLSRKEQMLSYPLPEIDPCFEIPYTSLTSRIRAFRLWITHKPRVQYYSPI